MPFNYKHSKNISGNPDYAPSESVIISGYPSISYITDYYNSWLAQNSRCNCRANETRRV